MLGRGVPDMGGELPARVRGVGPAHVPIAGLLGDHGGCGNGRARGIAADHRPLLVLQRPNRKAVAQTDAPWAGDPAERVVKSGQVRHVQATGVDPGGAPGDDDHPSGHAQDHWEQLRPLLRRLLLGVIEAGQGSDLPDSERLQVEQYGGRHQWAGQTTTAGFIGTGHEPGAEGAIELEQAARGAAGPGRATPPGQRSIRGSRFGRAASR